MKINIMNIFAGIGCFVILFFVVLIGMESRGNYSASLLANYSSFLFSDSNTGDNSFKNSVDSYNKDIIFSENICPYKNHYKTNSFTLNGGLGITQLQASKIHLGPDGNIWRFPQSDENNGVYIEVYDKNTGIRLKTIGPFQYPQSFGGSYVDSETGNIAIIADDKTPFSGQYGRYIYLFDKDGKTLNPPRIDGANASQVVIKNNFIFALSTENSKTKDGFLKKYDFNGDLKFNTLLPYKASDPESYSDLEINGEKAYIPYFTTLTILHEDKKYRDPRTGKEIIPKTYKHSTGILVYNTASLDKEATLFEQESEEKDNISDIDISNLEIPKKVSINRKGEIAVLFTKGSYFKNFFRLYSSNGETISEWYGSPQSFGGYRDILLSDDGNVFALDGLKIDVFKKICGKITIEKQTIPQPDETIFTFIKKFLDLSDFVLKDKESRVFLILDFFDSNKFFTVIEKEIFSETGLPLYSISVECFDNSGKSIFEGRIANISLNNENSGEVKCIFYNYKYKINEDPKRTQTR